MTDELVKVGRLAFRQEGKMWNAYYALPDTMEGASYIGSIAIVAVQKNTTRKKEFIEMMRGIISEILEERVGQEPTWGSQETAPEHEKAGNA